MIIISYEYLFHFVATPEREILWACENGKESVVKKILQQHPEAIGAIDSDGYTPLHRAAYSDFPEIIKVRRWVKGKITTHFIW